MERSAPKVKRPIFVKTSGRGFYDITSSVAQVVSGSEVQDGLANVYIAHTSASLIISENADPDVRVDLEAFMSRLVTDGASYYKHTAEGRDDMAAHIRSCLTNVSVGIPVRDRRLALGTWQSVFLWEHRYHAHQRQVFVTVVGSV